MAGSQTAVEVTEDGVILNKGRESVVDDIDAGRCEPTTRLDLRELNNRRIFIWRFKPSQPQRIYQG